MRMGVGQAHGIGAGRHVHEGGGEIGPFAADGRGRRREARCLEGRFAVEVVHGPVPGQGAHPLGQGALLGLVEVGGDPGVEDDERVVARDGGRDLVQILHHVALQEQRRVRRGSHVVECRPQAPEALRVVRPLTGQQPPCVVVGARVER